jgi:hypothetical protein
MDGCQSYDYIYYDSGNLKEKKGYLDNSWTILAATYTYSDNINSRADVVINNDVTWHEQTYDFNSINIPIGKTLTITGTALSNTPIHGEGALIVNGNLTVSSISIGTFTIAAGTTVTIAPIPGGPLAGGPIRPLNQEAAAIIGINTNQGNLYGADGIPVSPQIVGSTDNDTLKGGSL